jgi:hypothetical protein
MTYAHAGEGCIAPFLGSAFTGVNSVVVKSMSEGIGLIVDEEPAIRKYLRVVMRLRVLQSLEAGNAEEALLILENLGGQIDLLITDIHDTGRVPAQGSR